MKNLWSFLKYCICVYLTTIFICVCYIIGLTNPVGEWVSDKQLGVLVINDDGTGFRNLGSGNNEPFYWEYVEGHKIAMVPCKGVRINTTYAQADSRTGKLQINEALDFNPKKMITVYTRKPTTKNALLP